jgi:DNA-binding IclR family transcriptional regulator
LTETSDAPKAAPAGSGARSLRRAVAMLTLIHRRGQPQSLAEMALALSIPKSTAYDLLNAMLHEGLLTPAEGARFALGHRLHELGSGYRAQVDILREGARIVRALRDETGETVQLSAMEGPLMHVLMKEEGFRAVRIISNTGSRVPLNWAAAGRLLVSDLDDEGLRRILTSTVAPSPTGLAETDVDRLMAQIRAARAAGYAIEIGETNEHAGCVAAPVLDDDNKVIAALSLAAPEQRLNSPDRMILVAAARRAAADLGASLSACRQGQGTRRQGQDLLTHLPR